MAGSRCCPLRGGGAGSPRVPWGGVGYGLKTAIIYARSGVALAPLFWMVVRLLVGDHPLVGHLGLLGEGAFGVTDRAPENPGPRLLN